MKIITEKALSRNLGRHVATGEIKDISRALEERVVGTLRKDKLGFYISSKRHGEYRLKNGDKITIDYRDYKEEPYLQNYIIQLN